MIATTTARPSLTASAGTPVHEACHGLREHTVRIWTQALYCSPLRPSDRPTPHTVCQAIVEQLTACSRVPGGCTALIAQDVGDYPTGFPERIAWCQRTADHAYTVLLTLHPPQFPEDWTAPCRPLVPVPRSGQALH
ncbi:hypothetical protein [Kitasatospora sp. KL5]|uniref:hypothetical protein n=1 Tax=Kitasatospora sp. KL5 TaxID=3425125 RepID=UPI003D6FF10B